MEWNEKKTKKTTANKIDNVTRINQEILAKEGILKRYQDRIKQTSKTRHSKITKENSKSKSVEKE